MLETIEFKGDVYPKIQTEGFGSQYAFPFANKFCKGELGYDIGCNRPEWAFPGALPIDLAITTDSYHAFNLPPENKGKVDYIFSSHCLEHLPNWVEALEYWNKQIKKGGILFLYLPDFSQKYWRPWFDKQHVNCFEPKLFIEYIKDNDSIWKQGFVSGVDLMNSFMVVLEKKGL